MKIPERRHWRRSGIFIVSFEHISTRSSEFWITSTGVLKKKVFWKYAAKLQENTHAEVWFQ